jgi:hypothetical protein
MKKFRENYLAQIATALVASVMLVGSFKVNQNLDYLMLFAPGVSLIFIPAGVKLLCILVGGLPAAIGVYIGSVYLSTLMWTQVPSMGNMFMALIAVATYGLAVYLVMQKFRIKPDLSNLNYWHVIWLSSAASLMNGFGLNVAYFSQGVTTASEFFSKSTAMAFGDFLGCFVIVMLFNIAIQIVKKFRSNSAASETTPQ